MTFNVSAFCQSLITEFTHLDQAGQATVWSLWLFRYAAWQQLLGVVTLHVSPRAIAIGHRRPHVYRSRFRAMEH